MWSVEEAMKITKNLELRVPRKIIEQLRLNMGVHWYSVVGHDYSRGQWCLIFIDDSEKLQWVDVAHAEVREVL